MSPVPSVAVCICSYRRPQLLRRTLEAAARLRTDGRLEYHIVVSDNDRERSAEPLVKAFAASAPIRVIYSVEPEQNISLARNNALAHAQADLIAFIDDDEYPGEDWLLRLLDAMERFQADGVLAPVQAIFDSSPPGWITRGRFFDKPRRRTGTWLRWPQTSTANVMFARRIVEGVALPFRPEFGSGCEDVDFFRRMIAAGRRFVWCDEAVVTEVVPPTRWTRRYLVRRALLRGRNGWRFADAQSIAKSVVAIPLYSLMLPFLLVAGQHHFVRYLMKLGDHVGKLIGVLRLNLLGDKYLAG